MAGVITVTSEVRYRDEFGRFQRIVDDAVRGAVDFVGERGVDNAQRLAPEWLDDTTIVGEQTGSGFRWYSVHPWARAAEFGIPPHVIAPGEKGVLANKPLGFGPVRRAVKHPGVKGTAFLRRSYDIVKGLLLREIDRRIPG